MFGTFKFLLAILVFLSHGEFYPQVPGFEWFSLGVLAVVGFFIVSGYLMKLVFIQKYNNDLKKMGTFWKDRWLRIFPTYYFYLFIIVLLIYLTHYAKLNLTFSAVVAHLTLLPFNFQLLIPMQALKGWAYWALIIPQAWYLALEFQFYLVLPFIFKKIINQYVVIILSLAVSTLAMLKIIPTVLWEYHMLAGTIWMFLTGSLIYDIRFGSQKIWAKRMLLFIYFYLIILAGVLIKMHLFSYEYGGFIILGYLIFMPIVYLLSSIKVRPKWDDSLGNLSYGVFLNHYFLLWMSELVGIPGHTMPLRLLRVIVLLPVSIALSYLSFSLFDKRIRNVRLLVRKEK